MATIVNRRATVVAHPAVAVCGGSPIDPFVGRVICRRFRILALIGHTGTRRVYLAEQLQLGRLCTLKVLHTGRTSHVDGLEPDSCERFWLEATLMSKLRHPNTVAIFDCGEADDAYYVAMEYLEGHTLRTAVQDAGRFSEERTAHIARQIGWSLGEAHAVGLVHGRMTSSSVYLVEQRGDPDFVKVFDFALAENFVRTNSSGVFGPESLERGKVDARADVHALGALMYEMVTGGSQGDGVLEPSPGMQELMGRSLGWRSHDPFRTMDEMLTALEGLVMRR
jgi:eukaryotic-like serine/threonine-protein kinase